MPKQAKTKKSTGSNSSKVNNKDGMSKQVQQGASEEEWEAEVDMAIDALAFTLQKQAHAAMQDAAGEKIDSNAPKQRGKTKIKNKNDAIERKTIATTEKRSLLLIEKQALDKENEKMLLLEKFFRSFQRHLTKRECKMIVLRYLISYKFEIGKAIDNCIKTAEFRRREHLHRMLLFPSLIPLRGYDEMNICTNLHLQYGDDIEESPVTPSLAGFPALNSATGIGSNNNNNGETAAQISAVRLKSSLSITTTPSTICNESNEMGLTSERQHMITEKKCTSHIDSMDLLSTQQELNTNRYYNNNNNYNNSNEQLDKKNSIVNTNSNINNHYNDYYNVDYLTLYSTPFIEEGNSIGYTSNNNDNQVEQMISPLSSSPVRSTSTSVRQQKNVIADAEHNTNNNNTTNNSNIIVNNNNNNTTNSNSSAIQDSKTHNEDKHVRLLERILSHIPFTWKRVKENKVSADDEKRSITAQSTQNYSSTKELCKHERDTIDQNTTFSTLGATLQSENNWMESTEGNISFSQLLRRDNKSLMQENKVDNMSSIVDLNMPSSTIRRSASSNQGNNEINTHQRFANHSEQLGSERSASASATSTMTTTTQGLDFSMELSDDKTERLYNEIEHTLHGRGKLIAKNYNNWKNINNNSTSSNTVELCNQRKEYNLANFQSYRKEETQNDVRSSVNRDNKSEDNVHVVAEDDEGEDSNIILDYHPLLEPIITTILRHVPITFHYWDKKGHPIMYCKFAMLRSRLLTDELFHLTPLGSEPVALCALFQAYTLEITQQLIRYNDYKNMDFNKMSDALQLPNEDDANNHTGSNHNDSNKIEVLPKRSHIETCVVVLDCANVQYRHLLYRPLLRMMRGVVKLSQEHWPELLHHIYVVNCHKIIRLAYLLIKNTLSESTRRKITFCDRQFTPVTLREVIDKEFLPQEFGGNCCCLGGCLKVISSSIHHSGDDDDDDDDDESSSATVSSMQNNTPRDALTTIDSPREEDLISWVSERSSRRLSQRQVSQVSFARDTHFSRTARKFVIRPRQRESLTFAVNNKEEIIWEFAVKHRRKVSFSAVFIPAEGDGGIYSLATSRKVFEDANHYVCPCAGTIIFKWKNEVYFGHNAHVHVKVYRDDQSNEERH